MKNLLRLLIIAITIGVVGFFIWNFFSSQSRRTRADQPRVTISLNPTRATLPVNGEQTVEVLIQPRDADVKLSAVEIAFDLGEGSMFVSGGDALSPYPSGAPDTFTNLTYTKEDNRIMTSFSSLKTDSELPHIARLQLIVRKTQTGISALRVNTTKTHVVGTIQGYEYDVETPQEAIFSFNPTATPAPTSTPEPTLVPTNTPVPPTATTVPSPTPTIRPTNTPVPPTLTPTPTPTTVPTPPATNTPVLSPTGVSPQPTATIIPSPTPAGCLLKSEGDADCNGGINLTDFDIWRGEYLGEDNTRHSDFDDDGRVTLTDFEVWRRTYLQ